VVLIVEFFRQSGVKHSLPMLRCKSNRGDGDWGENWRSESLPVESQKEGGEIKKEESSPRRSRASQRKSSRVDKRRNRERLKERAATKFVK
jgi:hypothetical protein